MSIGYIYSPVQVEIYDWVERVGPCPTAVLKLIFGDKALKHLYYLRRQRYLYDLKLANIDFWIPQNYGRFEAKGQELLSWFAFRWEQGGGQYQNRVAISPNGHEFAVRVEREKIIVEGDNQQFNIILKDLQEKTIKYCLK